MLASSKGQEKERPRGQRCLRMTNKGEEGVPGRETGTCGAADLVGERAEVSIYGAAIGVHKAAVLRLPCIACSGEAAAP